VLVPFSIVTCTHEPKPFLRNQASWPYFVNCGGEKRFAATIQKTGGHHQELDHHTQWTQEPGEVGAVNSGAKLLYDGPTSRFFQSITIADKISCQISEFKRKSITAGSEQYSSNMGSVEFG